MREEIPSLVVVLTSDFYYGTGADLEAAIAQAYQAGARGSKEAVIYIYTGPQEYLDQVTIDKGGGVHYHHAHVTSHRVGKVKLPMKQREGK